MILLRYCLIKIFRLLFSFSILILPQALYAQVITNFSGNYFVGFGYSGDGSNAIHSQFNRIQGLAIDPQGDLFVADMENNRIRKIAAGSTIVSTYAGNGILGYSGDNNPATNAKIYYPRTVATDKAGNLYFSDNNCVIRKVDINFRYITTVAGTGVSGFSGDGGLATLAQFQVLGGIAVDDANNIYALDGRNNRIRKIAAGTNIITTYAGTGAVGYSGDGGRADSATLNNPASIAVDKQGNIYFTDQLNNVVRRVDVATKIITTAVGTGVAGFSGDGGPAILAQLTSPLGIAIDSKGNLYIEDNTRIRKVDASSGLITTIAGTDVVGYSGDGGLATSAAILLNASGGMVIDTLGNVFFSTDNRIRKIDATLGTIVTITGKYIAYSGDGGPPDSVVYKYPDDVEIDPFGNMLINDGGNNRIRKLDMHTMHVTSFAGNGVVAFTNDGSLADTASLGLIGGIALDKLGNVYLADYKYTRVRKIDILTHILTTVAGTGADGINGRGGLAVNAQFDAPNDLAIDSAGNIFIDNWFAGIIDKIDAVTHIVTTVVGKPYTLNFSGDGGLAQNASLYFPWSIALDRHANIYIADAENYRIRKVDAQTKIITTIAGNGTPVNAGDGGLALNASIDFPVKIRIDKDDNIYITGGNKLRRIDANTGIITAVAGTGIADYSGDGGLAIYAKLNQVTGIAFDNSGDIFVGDNYNNVIREISPGTLPIQIISFSGNLYNANEVLLRWTTSVMDKNAHFDIQYSSDGSNFSDLAIIAADNQLNQYSWIHCCPLPGANHYRLKITGGSGGTNFSKVVVISLSNTVQNLKVLPNPASSFAIIKYPSLSIDQIIRVTNSVGEIVRSFQAPKQSTETYLSLQGLPKGVYFIEMTNKTIGKAMLLIQ